METTFLEDLRIQTVLDSGFYIHKKVRDSNPHSHLNFELYFVEAGKCIAICKKQSYELKKGDLLLIPSAAEHNVERVEDDTSIYSMRCSFYPTNEQAQGLYVDLIQNIHSPIHIKNQPRLIEPLFLCRWELAQQQVLYEEKIGGILRSFYIDFIRFILGAPTAERPNQPFSVTVSPKNNPKGFADHTPEDFYIDRIDDFFTHLPPENMTLTELASRLYLSVSQTQRLIKRYYGTSFQQKLMSAKILKATRLMSATDLPLEQIAEQVGYRSYNAFFEAFTSLMHQTPSEYRQSSKTT